MPSIFLMLHYLLTGNPNHLPGCTGFFLLAMISLSLFPIIKKDLEHLPVLQEKLISGLLTPLAIADVSFPNPLTRITEQSLTRLFMPMDRSPSQFESFIRSIFLTSPNASTSSQYHSVLAPITIISGVSTGTVDRPYMGQRRNHRCLVLRQVRFPIPIRESRSSFAFSWFHRLLWFLGVGRESGPRQKIN